MGGNKELMLQHEEELSLATNYLVRVGELQRCEYHGEVYGGAFGDLERDFYQRAMADRKRGDNGPIHWASQMETREFTDLLKRSYFTNSGDGCGFCAKHEAE